VASFVNPFHSKNVRSIDRSSENELEIPGWLP
jgi:hypothetical protein